MKTQQSVQGINKLNRNNNQYYHCRWDFDRTKTPESVVSQFSLVCSNDVQRSLGSSLYMAAKIIGSLVFGVLSDKFGRKKVLLGASLLLTLSGVSTSFAPNMETWIVLRAFVALSATGLFITGFTYCMEMVGGVWSTLVSFGLEYSWALGYLTVPLIAWAAPAWSGLQLAVSVPTLVFTILVAIPGLVPESPRWLLAAGKKEADEVINKISKTNGIEINSYNMDTQADKKLAAEAQSGSLLDLFKSWPLIRCTLIMYYLWFTNNLVYYGFTLNAGKLFPGDLHINMLVSASLEFLAYTISIFAFLFLGRRWSVCSFMSLGGLSLLLTLALDSEAAKAALAQTGKFLITASFAMVYQYAAEMFPTVVRNAGIGSCSAFSRIGSILAPFVGREMVDINKENFIHTNNLLLKLKSNQAEVSPIAPMLIFGFTALLAGVLTLFLPETKNVTLPDTIKVCFIDRIFIKNNFIVYSFI